MFSFWRKNVVIDSTKPKEQSEPPDKNLKTDPKPIQKDKSNKKKENKFWEKLTFVAQNYLILEPNSLTRNIWDIIAFIVVLYNCFIITFRACFSLYDIWPWIIFDIIADIILWIDIILNFSTSFMKGNKPIYNHYEIAKNYISSPQFWMDILANLHLDIGGYIFGGYPWWRMNRLLRLHRYSYYFNALENTFFWFPPAIFSLLFYVLIGVFITHVLTGGYNMVMMYEGLGEEDGVAMEFMLAKHPIVCYPVISRYLRGFYAVLIYMGGTQPESNLETAYSLICCFFGLIIVVVVIGSVTDLVAELDQSQNEYQSKMDEITAFMNYRGLPMKLRKQIIEYYEYIWKSRGTFCEESVLDDLPIDLKIEVVMALNRDIINKVELFKNVSEQFVQSIMLKLKPKVALQGVDIISEGDSGREMFFINKGEVDIMNAKTGEVYVTLKDGSFFGEIALLKKVNRTATVRAKVVCDLFVLYKDDFEEIMEEFPEDADEIKKVAAIRYSETKK